MSASENSPSESQPATASSATPVAEVLASPGPAGIAHLDLLLDVPLEATLRFGTAEMLLGDLLTAGPGTLITLDRELHEPADLLVAGRLIARGEVVVVNGCFGLRITQLANVAASALL